MNIHRLLPLLLLLSTTVATTAAAQEVEHHGYNVKLEGTVQDCLSCHDGSQAHSVSVCTVKCDFRSAHAVLKRYPPARHTSDYAPVSDVTAKGVRIVNGMVTCISCHDLRNTGRFHLVLDEKHKLCSICHVKQARQFEQGRMQPKH